MDTPTPPPIPDRLGLLGVARLLVLLQGAVLVATTIESLVVLAAMGPSALPTTVLTGAAAALTLLTAALLGRGGRWARRWTIVAELGVLLFAAVDLVIAAILGGLELLPMPVAMRLVVPAAVIAILLQPSIRRRHRIPDSTAETPGDPLTTTRLTTEGGRA
jgi:hypothetical protein